MNQELEQEYAEWERREAAFRQRAAPEKESWSSYINALKVYSLFCGACGHGNGCEHGVPRMRK